MVGDGQAGNEALNQAFADQQQASQVRAPEVGSPRIPVALSSEDLHDLTAALASYIERQAFSAPRA